MIKGLSKSNLLFEIFVLGMTSYVEGMFARSSSEEKMEKAIKDMEELALSYGYKMEDFDKEVS